MACTMLAQVDDEGTAMSESAICGDCATTVRSKPASLLDCSGNDALSCQSCGIATARLPQLTSHIKIDGDFDPLAQNVLLYALDPVKYEAEARWGHIRAGLYDDRWIDGRAVEADMVDAALDTIAHTDFDAQWCPSCQVTLDQLLHAIRVIDRLLARVPVVA